MAAQVPPLGPRPGPGQAPERAPYNDEATANLCNLFYEYHANLASEVEKYLGQGANPNGRDSKDRPVLLMAAIALEPAVVQVLLVHGADPNSFLSVEVKEERDKSIYTWRALEFAFIILISDYEEHKNEPNMTVTSVLSPVVFDKLLAIFDHLRERDYDINCACAKTTGFYKEFFRSPAGLTAFEWIVWQGVIYGLSSHPPFVSFLRALVDQGAFLRTPTFQSMWELEPEVYLDKAADRVVNLLERVPGYDRQRAKAEFLEGLNEEEILNTLRQAQILLGSIGMAT